MRRIVGLFRCNSGVLASKRGTYATLTLSAPGNSLEEQLQALDAALTETGVPIDAAATNCGELTAVSPSDSEQAAGQSIVDPGTLEVMGQNSFVFETTLDTVISEAQFTDMNKRFKARSGQPGYTGLLGVDEILRRQVLLDAEHTLRRLPDLGSVLPQ